jgi:hypothetical protein
MSDGKPYLRAVNALSEAQEGDGSPLPTGVTDAVMPAVSEITPGFVPERTGPVDAGAVAWFRPSSGPGLVAHGREQDDLAD